MIRFEILLFILLVDVFGGPGGKDPVSPDNPLMLQCPNTPVPGEDGKPVILPCSTKNKMDISNDLVEWLFKDPTTGDYKHVHTYYQRKDQLHKQRDDFKNRTSLFKKELSSGNCSLRLQVTTSHNGTYQCRVVIDGKPDFCQVNLEVLPKGKNNTSLGNQDVTVSPVKPPNGTDGLTTTEIVVVAAPLLLIGIIFGVYCYCKRRKGRKHICRRRNANNSQTHPSVSYRAQQTT